MKTYFFFLSCLIVTNLGNIQAQETKSALFLGNSYTGNNNLPNLINSIANPLGDTLITDRNTPGGHWLQHHVGNTTSLQKIRQGNWDFVVLQEQSQKPSFSPAQVAAETYPYAAQLNDSIELYNPCAETVFYMTWGRKNGDQQNCAVYAPSCTYTGMQGRLRTSYLEMMEDNDAISSPVGAVWKYVRDSFPGIELYSADESHPSYAGSYLAACTFYATLFRKSPVGSTHYGSLSNTTAQTLQSAVAHVVLDSLSTWNIGDFDAAADFSYRVNQDTPSVDFTNTSASDNQVYFWNFGDGNTSRLENPSHTYTATGTYTVTLIAGCVHPDTTTQTVSIDTTSSLERASLNTTMKVYPNPVHQQLYLEAENPIEIVELVDVLGQRVYLQNSILSPTHQLNLSGQRQGIYMLRIKTKGEKWFSQKIRIE